jgi:pimeloyl-ACP methyl ester carboxylesterase
VFVDGGDDAFDAAGDVCCGGVDADDGAESGSSWGSKPAPSGVPTAVANFQGDHAVRGLAEKANTIVRWTEYPAGGHFASLQAPTELVTDIREFFQGISR